MPDIRRRFQNKMTQTLESEVSLMCNLSKGVEEQGIQKGLQKDWSKEFRQ